MLLTGEYQASRHQHVMEVQRETQLFHTLIASSICEAADSRKNAITSIALVVPAKPDTNAAVTAANLSVALGPPATA